MDEKQVLIELIKSVPGGDVAAAAKIGVSVGLLRAMRQGRREISDKTARKFGYTRRVVYERIPPPADGPDTDTRRELPRGAVWMDGENMPSGV